MIIYDNISIAFYTLTQYNYCMRKWTNYYKWLYVSMKAFGAPFMVVMKDKPEVFWGQDRIELMGHTLGKSCT